MSVTIVIGKHQLLAGLSVLSLTALLGIALVAAPVVSATTLASFNTAGYHVWTVPKGVTKVTFIVYGASGGSYLYHIGGVAYVNSGGAGGEAKGTFKVTPGEKFQINVGGQGANVSAGSAGGFNGGGPGGSHGAGGGGASDVRHDGVGFVGCNGHALYCNPDVRFIVAGGGGGAGTGYAGGNGGGVDGVADQSGGSSGGSQFGYYDQFEFFGWFGQGGSNAASGTAGGGGGWFGGDSPSAAGVGRGGGGGSAYISALALSGSFPGGTRTGDGLVLVKTA